MMNNPELSNLVQLTTELKSSIDEMKENLANAIPAEDYMGHKLYHENIIALQKRKLKLMDAIIEKTLTALVYGGILYIAAAVWTYFKFEVKK